MTLDREKKEDGLGGKGSVSPNGGGPNFQTQQKRIIKGQY